MRSCAASGCAGTRPEQAGLRGPLLALADRCDRAFMSLAAIWDASNERHPASLPAAWLGFLAQTSARRSE